MRTGVMGAVVMAGTLIAAAPAGAAQARVGFYGGVTVSTLGGADAGAPASRVASQGGAFLTLPLSPVVSLRGGLAMVQKGAQESLEGFTVRLALTYLEFPLLVQFTIPSDVAISAHGILGPVIGIEAACDFEVESPEGSGSAQCDSPLLQGAFPTKSTDVGLLLGAGVTIAPDNPINVLLQITYELGVGTIDSGTPPFDVKNRALGFAAGLSFAMR